MRFFLFAAILPLASQTSWAQLQNENLLQNMPSGYKVDFQTKQGNMVLREMVPQGESVNNWSEMVTTQIFLGLKTFTPQQMRDGMQQQAPGFTDCKGHESASVAEGHENGYPFAVWMQYCPLNQATGKPE